MGAQQPGACGRRELRRVVCRFFDRVAAVFGARPSVDKHGGGAGPCRYFVLELSGNRLAMLESCAAYRDIHPSLPVSRLLKNHSEEHQPMLLSYPIRASTAAAAHASQGAACLKALANSPPSSNCGPEIGSSTAC
jgi:hypothetical protein